MGIIFDVYGIFHDEDGSPLEAGFVYIGAADADPKTNPKQVYFDADLTILASQPLRTIYGRIAQQDGTSASNIYVNGEYSIVVEDRNNVLVSSSQRVANPNGLLALEDIDTEGVISGLVSTTGNLSTGLIDALDKAADVASDLLDAEGRLNDLETDKVTIGPNGEIVAGGNVVTIAGTVFNDGALGLEKLVAGLGRNLLSNASFIDGLLGWEVLGSTGVAGSQSILKLRPAGSTFAGKTYPTLQIRQTGNSSDGFALVYGRLPQQNGDASSSYVPVDPDKWYMFSAQIEMASCLGEIRIFWRDKDGTFIGFTAANVPNLDSQPDNPDKWTRYHTAAVQPPAGAAFANPVFYKYGTNTGAAVSDMFIHKPMFEETHAGATKPSAWSPSGQSLITGEGIITNSVGTRELNTIELSVAGLAVFGGNLQSINFGPNTGWRIGQDGEFTLKNLIVRDAMTDGAVSDIYEFYAPGTQPPQAQGQRTQFTLSLGATSIRQPFSLGFRAVKIDTPAYSHLYRLQRRIKLGGSFGGWGNIGSWGTNDSDTLKAATVFQEDSEDTQIRFITIRGEKSTSGNEDVSVIRDIGICVRSVQV